MSAQQSLHLEQSLSGLAMQKPVLAHATQATGQDVLEQAPEEVDQRHGSVGGGPGVRIAIAERDQALFFVESDQVVFADHAARVVCAIALRAASAPW